MRAGRTPRRVVLALLVAAVGRPVAALPQADGAGRSARPRLDDSSCRSCHAGIEEMHPEAALDCVTCHGGNGAATTKGEAHVRAPVQRSEDERVPPPDKDLAWIQFV